MKRDRFPVPFSLGPIRFVRFLWHLPNFVKLYWRLYQDKRVPWYAKLLLAASVGAAVAYFLCPIDFPPDALLGLGQVDDLLVACLLLIPGLRLFIRLCPKDVVQEHVRKIDQGF